MPVQRATIGNGKDGSSDIVLEGAKGRCAGPRVDHDEHASRSSGGDAPAEPSSFSFRGRATHPPRGSTAPRGILSQTTIAAQVDLRPPVMRTAIECAISSKCVTRSCRRLTSNSLEKSRRGGVHSPDSQSNIAGCRQVPIIGAQAASHPGDRA
jgi:hypothetical protein